MSRQPDAHSAPTELLLLCVTKGCEVRALAPRTGEGHGDKWMAPKADETFRSLTLLQADGSPVLVRRPGPSDASGAVCDGSMPALFFTRTRTYCASRARAHHAHGAAHLTPLPLQKQSPPLHLAWAAQSAVPKGLAKQSSLMHALPPPDVPCSHSRERAESHQSPRANYRYSEDIVPVAARLSDSDASDGSEWDEELEAAAAAGGGSSSGREGDDGKAAEKGCAAACGLLSCARL